MVRTPSFYMNNAQNLLDTGPVTSNQWETVSLVSRSLHHLTRPQTLLWRRTRKVTVIAHIICTIYKAILALLPTLSWAECHCLLLDCVSLGSLLVVQCQTFTRLCVSFQRLRSCVVCCHHLKRCTAHP